MTYKQQLVMLNLFQHLFPEKYFNGRFRNKFGMTLLVRFAPMGLYD